MFGTAFALFLVALAVFSAVRWRPAIGFGFSGAIFLYVAGLLFVDVLEGVPANNVGLSIAAVIAAWLVADFFGERLVRERFGGAVLWIGFMILYYWLFSFVQGFSSWYLAGHHMTVTALHQLWLDMHADADAVNVTGVILASALTYTDVSWLRSEVRWHDTEQEFHKGELHI